MGPDWNAWTLTGLRAWPSRHATQRRQVLQQSLRFAHDRYEAGHASDLEELDAQRNLYAAELDAQRNLYAAELDNRVQLYKALGGWQPADVAPSPKP